LVTLPCDFVGHQLKEANLNQYFWATQKINDVRFRCFFKFLFPKFKERLQILFFLIAKKIHQETKTLPRKPITLK
jgi:hypothetical protein